MQFNIFRKNTFLASSFICKSITTCLFVFCIALTISAQQTPYELKGKNYTATYDECIAYYEQLDQAYSCITMKTMGMTDAGKPLHVADQNATDS